MSAPVHFDVERLQAELMASIDRMREKAEEAGDSPEFMDAQCELMRLLVPVKMWVIRHGVNGALGREMAAAMFGAQVGGALRQACINLGKPAIVMDMVGRAAEGRLETHASTVIKFPGTMEGHA